MTCSHHFHTFLQGSTLKQNLQIFEANQMRRNFKKKKPFLFFFLFFKKPHLNYELVLLYLYLSDQESIFIESYRYLHRWHREKEERKERKKNPIPLLLPTKGKSFIQLRKWDWKWRKERTYNSLARSLTHSHRIEFSKYFPVSLWSISP